MSSSQLLLTVVQFLILALVLANVLKRMARYLARLVMQRSVRVKLPKEMTARQDYAVVETSGPWPMEDRTLVYPLCLSPPTSSVYDVYSSTCTLYAVFDGHHGSSCAQYLVDNLGSTVQHQLSSCGAAPRALFEAYRQLDANYLTDPQHESGSTCCTLLVNIETNTLTVANTGDSRCILVSSTPQGGRVTELSRDHKPDREDERERILQAGGAVSFWGVWRVQGILAMSRAIGDRALKRFAIPDPEIIEHVVRPTDRYAVLATDGVWDVLSSEQVGRICSTCGTADECAVEIMHQVIQAGMVDNTTVLVVDLAKRAR